MNIAEHYLYQKYFMPETNKSARPYLMFSIVVAAGSWHQSQKIQQVQQR